VIVGWDCKTDGDTGKGQREVRTLPVRTRCSERQVYGCVGTSENLIVLAIWHTNVAHFTRLKGDGRLKSRTAPLLAALAADSVLSGIRPHLPIWYRFKRRFEPLVRRRRFFQEHVEIVRWIVIFQHPFERRIGIRLAAISAQGLVFVHPCHRDDLRIAAEPVEQSILLEEFRPEPVLAVITGCRLAGRRRHPDLPVWPR
jgi:hypothetical protein